MWTLGGYDAATAGATAAGNAAATDRPPVYAVQRPRLAAASDEEQRAGERVGRSSHSYGSVHRMRVISSDFRSTHVNHGVWG
jgi:hypothetical protein